MGQALDDSALDTLFREARSYSKWLPRPITDETLRELYDLVKWAPTSANAAPARFDRQPAVSDAVASNQDGGRRLHASASERAPSVVEDEVVILVSGSERVP